MTVQHYDRLRVSGLMTSTVEGPRVQNTGATFAENIAGYHRRTTAGDCQFTTQKSRTDKVGGDRAATVSGGETVTIGCSAVTKIGKSQMLDVSGWQTIRICSKDDDGATLSIKGDYHIDATGGIEIRADKVFSLRCGSTTLNVTPDVIKLMAKSLIMAGTSSAAISGNGPSIQLDDRLSLSAKHVKLAAQEDFDLTANKTIRLITSKSSFRLD